MNQLFDALSYLKMGELKALCLHLGLPYTANPRSPRLRRAGKGQDIEGIEHCITTGKIHEPEISIISIAK